MIIMRGLTLPPPLLALQENLVLAVLHNPLLHRVDDSLFLIVQQHSEGYNRYEQISVTALKHYLPASTTWWSCGTRCHGGLIVLVTRVFVDQPLIFVVESSKTTGTRWYQHSKDWEFEAFRSVRMLCSEHFAAWQGSLFYRIFLVGIPLVFKLVLSRGTSLVGKRGDLP